MPAGHILFLPSRKKYTPKSEQQRYQWYVEGGERNTISWTVEMGRVLDASAFHMGEWSLSPHHVYNKRTGQLIKGDGTFRDVRYLGKVIKTFKEDVVINDLALGDNSTVYFASGNTIYTAQGVKSANSVK